MLQPEAQQLTPREAQIMQYEKEQLERSMAHELAMKQLDVKWQAVFRIPLAIIMLPVKVVAAIGICVAYACKKEPSDNFWRFIR